MIAVVATLDGPGLTWDEPAYRYSELYMQQWFEALFEAETADQRRELFSAASLHYYWRYNRYGPNFHPPLAGVFANLNWVVFRHVMHDYPARRMASAILFALTVSSLFVFVRRRYGSLGAWGAALSLGVMPRVFGHAHLAGTDIPTMAIWWFTFVAFVRALESRGWRVGFGVLLGLCFLTKFTAVLVVAPCLVWAVIYRRRSALWTLLTGAAVAPVVAVALNPAWWHDTFRNLGGYLDLVLGRKAHLPDIEIFYWGKQYIFSLPPMNAYVLMGITIPLGILLVGAVGVVLCVIRPRKDPLGVLVVGQLLLMPVARMWPTAPGHDGVRLFLITFVFYALCAGRGLQASAWWLTRPAWLRQGLGRALVVAVLLLALVLPPLVHTVQYHPYYLSYYNEIIGGVRGAFCAGFEPTYWYDACDRPFLRWMNANLPRGAAVTDLTVCEALSELQALGQLRGDLRIDRGRAPGELPYGVHLTHTSKINDFKRLYFAMAPMRGSQRSLGPIPLVSVRSPEAYAQSWALLLLHSPQGKLASTLRAGTDVPLAALRLMREEALGFEAQCAGVDEGVGRLARVIRRIPYGGDMQLRRLALATVGWQRMLKQQLLGRMDYLLVEHEADLAAALRYTAAVRRVFEHELQGQPQAVRTICEASWLAQGQTWHGRTPIVDPAYLQDPGMRETAVRILRHQILPSVGQVPPPPGERARRLATFVRVYDYVELLRSLDPTYQGEGPARVVSKMVGRLSDPGIDQAVRLAAESVRRLMARASGEGPDTGQIVWELNYPLTWHDLRDLLVHHWPSVQSAVTILADRRPDVQKILDTPRYLLPHEYGGYLDQPKGAVRQGDRQPSARRLSAPAHVSGGEAGPASPSGSARSAGATGASTFCGTTLPPRVAPVAGQPVRTPAAGHRLRATGATQPPECLNPLMHPGTTARGHLHCRHGSL